MALKAFNIKKERISIKKEAVQIFRGRRPNKIKEEAPFNKEIKLLIYIDLLNLDKGLLKLLYIKLKTLNSYNYYI